MRRAGRGLLRVIGTPWRQCTIDERSTLVSWQEMHWRRTRSLRRAALAASASRARKTVEIMRQPARHVLRAGRCRRGSTADTLLESSHAEYLRLRALPSCPTNEATRPMPISFFNDRSSVSPKDCRYALKRSESLDCDPGCSAMSRHAVEVRFLSCGIRHTNRASARCCGSTPIWLKPAPAILCLQSGPPGRSYLTGPSAVANMFLACVGSDLRAC